MDAEAMTEALLEWRAAGGTEYPVVSSFDLYDVHAQRRESVTARDRGSDTTIQVDGSSNRVTEPGEVICEGKQKRGSGTACF